MHCDLSGHGLLKYCLDTEYASSDETSSDDEILIMNAEQCKIRAEKIAAKKLRKSIRKIERRRSEAANRINNRLSQGIKSAIPLNTKTDSKELWRFLIKNYGKKNIMHTTTLLFEFFTMEQRENELLEPWFQRIQQITQKITATSFNLPDIFISTKLLHQTEYKYKAIGISFIQGKEPVDSIASKEDNEYTSEDIMQALINAQAILSP
ncbi:hypothetical protein HK096_001787, partial [Nowakowskiella sp. JEL0078]